VIIYTSAESKITIPPCVLKDWKLFMFRVKKNIYIYIGIYYIKNKRYILKYNIKICYWCDARIEATDGRIYLII